TARSRCRGIRRSDRSDRNSAGRLPAGSLPSPLRDDRQRSRRRIDLDEGVVRYSLGDVEVETPEHRKLREGCTLREDRIDGIEDESQRNDAPRFHFMQHPGSRDTAFGGVENENPVDVGLTGELVRRSGEHTTYPVEIVARRKAVLGDES